MSNAQHAVEEGKIQLRLSQEAEALQQVWLKNPVIPTQILTTFSSHPIFAFIVELRDAGFEVSDKIAFPKKNGLPTRSIVVRGINQRNQTPLVLLDITIMLEACIRAGKVSTNLFGWCKYTGNIDPETLTNASLVRIQDPYKFNTMVSGVLEVISAGYASPQNPPIIKDTPAPESSKFWRIIERMLFRQKS